MNQLAQLHSAPPSFSCMVVPTESWQSALLFTAPTPGQHCLLVADGQVCDSNKENSKNSLIGSLWVVYLDLFQRGEENQQYLVDFLKDWQKLLASVIMSPTEEKIPPWSGAKPWKQAHDFIYLCIYKFWKILQGQNCHFSLHSHK